MFGVAALNFTLLPEYVRRQRQGDAELVALVDRLVAWGWTVGLAVVAAGVAFGPWLVGFIAGAPYVEAGRLLPAILSSYVLFTLGQVLHVVRSARLADVGASAVVTVASALLAAGLGLWLIPVWGIRGAAAITLACFVVYFLGMAMVVRPVLPGPVTWLRPVLPMFCVAVTPLLLLVDLSAPMRAAVAIGTTAVAGSTWLRSSASRSR
jgi:O-antigen/teichoic acid export membrane protein